LQSYVHIGRPPLNCFVRRLDVAVLYSKEFTMADVLAYCTVVAVVLVFFALLWLSVLLQRTMRLSRIEAKLDLLLQNAGIRYDPYKSLPPAVAQALQRGDKITAIKEFREVTGADLREAKAFIEEAQRGLSPSA
jgi:hypothetical protein